MEVFLTHHDWNENDMGNINFGLEPNFTGIGVYVYRHPDMNDDWFVMTLQNDGTKGAIQGGLRVSDAWTKTN